MFLPRLKTSDVKTELLSELLLCDLGVLCLSILCELCLHIFQHQYGNGVLHRLMFPPAPLIIQLVTSHPCSPLNARPEGKRITILPHQYLHQQFTFFRIIAIWQCLPFPPKVQRPLLNCIIFSLLQFFSPIRVGFFFFIIFPDFLILNSGSRLSLHQCSILFYYD